jgi:glyoxylase-like metal-dependent hydrolase (beta-lactamase superfamily II)
LVEKHEQLGYGITCIDADYVRAGLACFYLLEERGEYAVIETGTSHSAANLENIIAERGIEAEQVRYVIPTHVHLDHAGGAGTLMARFPEAKLLIHPEGARHMKDPGRLIESSIDVYGERRFRRLYGEILPVEAGRVSEMGDGDAIELGGRRLEFRHTRGHANHHFCIWDEASRGWFTGDMFGLCYHWFRFSAGDFVLPATTPTQFDPEDYVRSLELLDSYGPRRMFLTHYGELAYTREKSELLARQVEGYRELAPAYAGDRLAMERALTEYSLQQLRAFDPLSSEDALREALAFDMDLNAQGLDCWQRRVGSAPKALMD